MKHNVKEISLKPGDVVMIKGDDRNRGRWDIGIVEKLIVGKDGVVRAATLRAGKSFLQRAIQHLYPLELSCDKTYKKRSINVNAREFVPKRNASMVAERLISNQMDIEQQDPLIE